MMLTKQPLLGQPVAPVTAGPTRFIKHRQLLYTMATILNLSNDDLMLCDCPRHPPGDPVWLKRRTYYRHQAAARIARQVDIERVCLPPLVEEQHSYQQYIEEDVRVGFGMDYDGIGAASQSKSGED